VERRRRVVVVGAGFGGLELVTHLRDVPVEVVLVDANNFHTFQPLLYQVATAGLDSDDIASPVRGIVNRQHNVDVRLGRVTGIDVESRRLSLDQGPAVDYDRLVLAAGAVTATFGVPGVEEHGFGLKSLADAVRLRHHVLLQFERASVDPSLMDDGILNVVIAGGGPTGVELAGGLMELFGKVLARDFPTLDVRRARVILTEPAGTLLSSFHPKLAERARRTLASRGVEVVLGQGVAGTDGKAVELTDGTRIPSPTLVWTAGVRANPLAEVLAEQLGAGTLTRGARIVVERDLTVPGHPEIAVIGDLAAATDGAGNLLPQVAPVAIQAGRLVAANLAGELEGRAPVPFRYRDKGSMATIGRHDAVAQLPGGLRFSGPLGWLAWLVLHLVMLIGFRNRANVLVNWAWNYVTYDRGSRLIVGSEEPSR
jgi:NADH:ubiquinone reductase (H+-translocating)